MNAESAITAAVETASEGEGWELARQSEHTDKLIARAAKLLQEESWLREQAKQARAMISQWRGKESGYWTQINSARREFEDLLAEIRQGG